MGSYYKNSTRTYHFEVYAHRHRIDTHYILLKIQGYRKPINPIQYIYIYISPEPSVSSRLMHCASHFMRSAYQLGHKNTVDLPGSQCQTQNPKCTLSPQNCTRYFPHISVLRRACVLPGGHCLAVIIIVSNPVILQQNGHTFRRPPRLTLYVTFAEHMTPWSPNVYDLVSFSGGRCDELAYCVNRFRGILRDDDGVAVVGM